MENQSFAMNRGDGPNSYAQNSSFQRGAFGAIKKLIEEAIAKKFDPGTHAAGPANLICIADLGCATGPNTYIAIQTITEAIETHYQSHNLAAPIPEFQVFFNDQVSNDFNTLFEKLPPNRNYFAAGVPGSFRGRLFPRGTLHFVYSASTLHWLSQVPKEIKDRTSTAWNKGRIHHTNAPKEVAVAYATQFQVDLESFLHARAQELVGNGLMALQIPTAPDMILDSDIEHGKVFELIGSSLVDMAKVGLVSEEKIDSFNLPIFYSPVKDVKAVLERIECFSIEQMEMMSLETFYAISNVHDFVALYRVVMEDLIEKHFGSGIVDELFDRFTEKVVEFPDIMNPKKLKLVMFFLSARSKHKKAF